ncbi:MAG: DUF2334 domain-containing protein [FCB group bacterium]|nr:DUF2334 domain-containing protein [FCB group bacterium]
MPKAQFIIRWDDVSFRQDRRKFQTLVDLFVKFDIPAVLGVIPDNQDPDISLEQGDQAAFVDELRVLEKNGWEIAQHGFRHIKHTDNGGILGLNKASEFAGRDYDQQLQDLEQGRDILTNFGFNPVTFIPPWHSYDKATIKALGQSGFKTFSDGLFLYPRLTENLLQLPMIFWSVPNRLSALEKMNSIYTICLHPQLIRDEDLTRLELFFKDYRPQVVTAASLLEQTDNLCRRSLKEMVLERIFAMTYKRQG